MDTILLCLDHKLKKVLKQKKPQQKKYYEPVEGEEPSFESHDCKLSNEFLSYLEMIIMKNMKTLKDLILKICKLDYISIVDNVFLIQWYCTSVSS